MRFPRRAGKSGGVFFRGAEEGAPEEDEGAPEEGDDDANPGRVQAPVEKQRGLDGAEDGHASRSSS
jgi:hypothetical protein